MRQGKISTITVKHPDIKIASFDPGFRNLGWAVISIENKTPYLIHSGTIVLPDEFVSKSEKDPRRKYDTFLSPEGLLWLSSRISNVISEDNVMHVAYERIFFGKNVSSVVGVIEVCGLIKTISAQNKALVYQYLPSQVKASTTGNTRANKEDVMSMVNNLTGYKPATDHEADAISTGIAHILALRGKVR